MLEEPLTLKKHIKFNAFIFLFLCSFVLLPLLLLIIFSPSETKEKLEVILILLIGFGLGGAIHFILIIAQWKYQNKKEQEEIIIM